MRSKDAITKLNSLQSNAATLEALRVSKARANAEAIPEMLEYLHRIGYSVCNVAYRLLLRLMSGARKTTSINLMSYMLLVPKEKDPLAHLSIQFFEMLTQTGR
jgi:hypothetical protein